MLVGLLLHSLEFAEEVFGGVLDLGLHSEVLAFSDVGLDQFGKDSMVDRQSVDGIEMLHKLQAHGAAHSPVAA